MYKYALLVTIWSFVAWGQTPPLFTTMSSRMDGDTTTVTFSGTMQFIGGVIKGAPYSGDLTFEQTQALADGTHIRHAGGTQQHLFRDSMGRTRTERPALSGSAAQRGGFCNLVEIVDPVSGYAFVLDDQNTVAHRVVIPQKFAPNGNAIVPLQRSTSATPRPVPERDPMQPQSSTEKLGTQTIEGLIADGTRMTTTWPVGSQGNDRPLVDTTEYWFSTELKVAVLSKATSVRNGESTTRLINVSRAEPDPALFEPPPNYTVVDEKGSFTVTLKRQE